MAVPPKKVEVPPPPSPSPIPEPNPLPKSVPMPRGSTTGSSKAGTEIEEAVVAEIGLILAALLAGCGFFLTFLAKSFI